MRIPPERSTRILIVQDEPAAAARLAADLKGLGHTVCGTAASGWQAVAQAAELLPELALVDLGCDDATGEAAEHLVGRCHVPVLYLVGDASDSVLERAAMSEPAGYLVKPFTAWTSSDRRSPPRAPCTSATGGCSAASAGCNGATT